jgi:protein-disulfide isomerase
MHDSLFSDQGRLDNPHLWERARALGLNLERFERDRHSDEVRARVKRDFDSGVRAGVVTTPTLFAGGRMLAGNIDGRTLDQLSAGRS